jgi:hypothetical protein
MAIVEGLLVNGPVEWYENLEKQFAKHKGTWLSQNKVLKPEYQQVFNRSIGERGRFIVLGYIQSPVKSVAYRFEVDKYVSKQTKTLPPDDSAPPFSQYDITQGKCDPAAYTYQTWLHAAKLTRIPKRNVQELTNLKVMKPIKSLHGQPHYYIAIPAELQGSDIADIVASDLESLASEEGRPEGAPVKRFSNYYERDPELRGAAVSIHGTICKVCQFDFQAQYGARGTGYIEVHHLMPVSELKGRASVNPRTEMTVVCANCHRMIHRRRDSILTPEELQAIIKKCH